MTSLSFFSVFFISTKKTSTWFFAESHLVWHFNKMKKITPIYWNQFDYCFHAWFDLSASKTVYILICNKLKLIHLVDAYFAICIYKRLMFQTIYGFGIVELIAISSICVSHGVQTSGICLKIYTWIWK